MMDLVAPWRVQHYYAAACYAGIRFGDVREISEILILASQR